MMLHYILAFIVWGRVFAVSVPYGDVMPPQSHRMNCPSGWPVVAFNVTESTGRLEVHSPVGTAPLLTVVAPKNGGVEFCTPQPDVVLKWAVVDTEGK